MQCVNCGATIHSEDYTFGKHVYCDKCWELLFFECYWCNKITPIENIKYLAELQYCEPCYAECYAVCSICGREYNILRSGKLCGDCVHQLRENARLLKYSQYIDSIITETPFTISKYELKHMSSILLMDTFKKSQKNILCITRAVTIYTPGYKTAFTSASLLATFTMEDMPSISAGSITMTEFKSSIPSDLMISILRESESWYKNNDYSTIVRFNHPIYLRAQTSADRCYGNHYVGKDLVVQGDLYGATSSFVFFGLRIE